MIDLINLFLQIVVFLLVVAIVVVPLLFLFWKIKSLKIIKNIPVKFGGNKNDGNTDNRYRTADGRDRGASEGDRDNEHKEALRDRKRISVSSSQDLKFY